MDSMGISKKMAGSKEFQNSQAALQYMLSLLKQQLELTKDLLNENTKLRSKGCEQYRTYANNKRRDKITSVMANSLAGTKMETSTGKQNTATDYSMASVLIGLETRLYA